jgi:hypothetical protein
VPRTEHVIEHITRTSRPGSSPATSTIGSSSSSKALKSMGKSVAKLQVLEEQEPPTSAAVRASTPVTAAAAGV